MIQLSHLLVTQEVSKKDIIEAATAEATALVEAANVNLLPTYIKIKQAQDYLETFNKGIQKTALAEAQNYNERSFKAHGARIEVKEAGARWNYEKCGDPVWEDLKAQEDAIAEKRKQREKFLQAISSHENIVQEDTGDLVTVYAPVKTSSTTLSITY